MREKIANKLKYYKDQRDKAYERYIESGLLRDRLSSVRLKERCKVLEEMAELTKENI